MALLKFLKGNYSNLNTKAIAEGQVLICGDTGEMFVDIASDKRVKIGDFTVVANITALEALDATSVPTSRLYYVEEGNILARSNGTTWIQVNKQPTTEELKGLLGLGSMAYLSEVSESNLNSALATKINNASSAQHTHSNETVLNGITSEKVAAWDASEGNAKTYADGLNTAMNTRVEALEAIDHSHTFVESELNKIVDGDVSKWNTAAGKAHTHTFNETELNKIVEGDVAKWNGVAADHLTSADKTTLENAIKEAKKAGTDANTNIETYKVANDARVLAVEEDVAEIVDGTNGILAQAKSYTDSKDSAMNTRVAALETAAPTHALKTEVEAVDAKFANYNTTVAQKAIDDAQDAEIAKKVAKTDYEADKATFATKTELGNVDAKFANYKTAADQKLIDDAQDVEIAKKVDKVEGKDLIATSEIERLATLKNYDDTALAGRVTTAEGKITALEGASATHATKDELAGVDAKFANYKTAEAQKAIDDEQDRRLGVIEGDYLKAADIANFETKENVKKVADDLAAYVTSNDAEVLAVRGIAEAARTESEVDGQIDAKITALNLGTTYEPIGAEDRAKAYVDGEIAEVEDRVTTAEGEIDALQEQIQGLSGAMHFKGTYGSLPVSEDYVKVGDCPTIIKINTGIYPAVGEYDFDLPENTSMSIMSGMGYYYPITIDRFNGNEFVIWNATYGGEGYKQLLFVSDDVSDEKLAELGATQRGWQVESFTWHGGDITSLNRSSQYTNDVEYFEFFLTEKAWDGFESGDVIAVGDKEYVFNGTEFVEFGDISAEGERLTALEGKVEVIEGKPAYGITATQISNWDNEVGAKALAESKTTTAEVKDQIEAYGYATTTALTAEKEAREAKESELATAIENAKTAASNQAAVVLAEAQAYADQAEADAIAAAKTETENQVKALNDGQVTTNKNDIADIMEMLTWGSF